MTISTTDSTRRTVFKSLVAAFSIPSAAKLFPENRSYVESLYLRRKVLYKGRVWIEPGFVYTPYIPKYSIEIFQK